jgi:hypothetical protein
MFIKDVFEQFLSEQQSKLAPKTYREYASVMDLFAYQLARIIHQYDKSTRESTFGPR